jgi:hypothetical protein
MIFEYFHTTPVGGHFGVYKTLQKIRDSFTWKNMARDVKRKVLCCQTCALSKPAQNTRMGFLTPEVAHRPFQKIFIDYVGKLPRTKSGNYVVSVC